MQRFISQFSFSLGEHRLVYMGPNTPEEKPQVQPEAQEVTVESLENAQDTLEAAAKRTETAVGETAKATVGVIKTLDDGEKLGVSEAQIEANAAPVVDVVRKLEAPGASEVKMDDVRTEMADLQSRSDADKAIYDGEPSNTDFKPAYEATLQRELDYLKSTEPQWRSDPQEMAGGEIRQRIGNLERSIAALQKPAATTPAKPSDKPAEAKPETPTSAEKAPDLLKMTKEEANTILSSSEFVKAMEEIEAVMNDFRTANDTSPQAYERYMQKMSDLGQKLDPRFVMALIKGDVPDRYNDLAIRMRKALDKALSGTPGDKPAETPTDTSPAAPAEGATEFPADTERKGPGISKKTEKQMKDIEGKIADIDAQIALENGKNPPDATVIDGLLKQKEPLQAELDGLKRLQEKLDAVPETKGQQLEQSLEKGLQDLKEAETPAESFAAIMKVLATLIAYIKAAFDGTLEDSLDKANKETKEADKETEEDKNTKNALERELKERAEAKKETSEAPANRKENIDGLRVEKQEKLDKNKEQIAELDTDIAELKKKNDGLIEERSEIEKKLNGLRGDDNQEDIDRFQVQLKTLNAQIKANEEGIDALDSQRDALTATNKTLEEGIKKLDSMKEDTEAAEEKVEVALDKVNKAIEQKFPGSRRLTFELIQTPDGKRIMKMMTSATKEGEQAAGGINKELEQLQTSITSITTAAGDNSITGSTSGDISGAIEDWTKVLQFADATIFKKKE